MKANVSKGLATALALVIGGVATTTAAQRGQRPQPVPSATKATLAIVGGYLIDGHGGPPVTDSVILVDGQQIVAVGSKGTVQVPPGARVVDASGYSILPGLFNTHVHLDLIGHSDYDEWHRKYVPGSAEYAKVCEAGAKQLIMGGVTTAVDLGGHQQTLTNIRDRINKGELAGPRLLISYGWIWHATPEVAAAHHRFNHTYNVHGAEEARAAALKTIAGGADIIKLWNGSTADEVKAVAEEAHKKGLRVTGHTGGNQDLIARVSSGQDGVEHTGFDVDNAEVMRLLISRRTVVVPTPIQSLASYEAFEWPEWRNDPRARALTPPQMWTEIRESIEHMDRLPYFGGAYRGRAAYEQAGRTVKRLYVAGVRLALGTDSGTPGNFHVDSTWRQMELYVNWGIPAMDVIATATRQSAQWLGVGNKTGTLVPGKMADLIIVDGNPLVTMSALKDPVYVFKEGIQMKGPAAAPQTRTSSAHQ